MTNEQINIAIAEACGWKDLENEDFSEYGVPCFMLMGSNNTGTRLAPPDYLNDLNAMHEAEGTLKIMEKIEMERLLEREIIGSDYLIWRATARQRAEAFLRTLGKWEEA